MGWSHMVASRTRLPRPALPDPNEQNQPRDRPQRRVADRPQIAPGRQPRSNFDGLAIGAPLTAALIGVLLTEGSAAFGEAGARFAARAAAARRAVATTRPARAEHSIVAGAARCRGGRRRRRWSPARRRPARCFDPIAAEAAAASGRPLGHGNRGSGAAERRCVCVAWRQSGCGRRDQHHARGRLAA